MTRSSTTTDWPRLMFDASQLWAEVGMVVSLRFWRMMAGGPAVARREAGRMVSEKIETGSKLLGALPAARRKAQQWPPARLSASMASACGEIAAV